MFQITIKEITTEKVTKKEYEKISDTGNKEDDGPVYGYEDKECQEEVERIVLSQEVEEVNVEEVIKAINNIK